MSAFLSFLHRHLAAEIRDIRLIATPDHLKNVVVGLTEASLHTAGALALPALAELASKEFSSLGIPVSPEVAHAVLQKILVDTEEVVQEAAPEAPAAPEEHTAEAPASPTPPEAPAASFSHTEDTQGA